jgi:phage baseplate assembly protein W
MPEQFIGQGWGFPLRTDSTGSIALSSGDQEIAEAIKLILMTSPGERPMRPRFGCAIHERMFSVADGEMIGQIKRDVMQALSFWEPRITVLGVGVTEDDDRSLNHLFYIDVLYVIKGSNDRRNLVYPFYVIPERGE